MPLISSGINFSQSWIFLIGIIFFVIRELIPEILEFLVKDAGANKNKPTHPMIRSFLMGFGMFLSFIFEIISKKLRKRETNENPRKTSKMSQIFLILFIIAVIDLGCFVACEYERKLAIDIKIYGEKEVSLSVEFFIVSIISWFVFRFIFHRHHIVYSIIIWVGVLGKVLTNFIGKFPELKPYLLLNLIEALFFPICIIVQKWLMDYRFISPFLLISIMGLFIMIISLLVCFCLIILGEQEFEDNLSLFSDVTYNFRWLAFSILSTGLNIFMVLVNKTFGPLHQLILELCSSFMVLLIKSDRVDHPILLLFCHLIILFGVLGFTEVIIIHLGGLDFDTKKEILVRSNTEIEFETEMLDKKRSILVET